MSENDSKDFTVRGRHVAQWADLLRNWLVPVILVIAGSAVSYALLTERVNRNTSDIATVGGDMHVMGTEVAAVRSEVVEWKARYGERLAALEVSVRDMRERMDKGFERVGEKLDAIKDSVARVKEGK